MSYQVGEFILTYRIANEVECIDGFDRETQTRRNNLDHAKSINYKWESRRFVITNSCN